MFGRKSGSLGSVCDNLGSLPSVCPSASHSLRVIRKSSRQELLGFVYLGVCVCACVCVVCAWGGRGPILYQAKVSTKSFLHNSVSDNTGAFLSTHITAGSIFASLFPSSLFQCSPSEPESIRVPLWGGTGIRLPLWRIPSVLLCLAEMKRSGGSLLRCCRLLRSSGGRSARVTAAGVPMSTENLVLPIGFETVSGDVSPRDTVSIKTFSCLNF